MRIGKTVINFFKGITKIETTLGNGVFYIFGKNESGKSSFLDGLMFALLGKKAFPKGKWKEIVATADSKTIVGCELVDNESGKIVLKITRKVGKTGNESVVIEDPSGKKFTQKTLDGLIESVSLNPKAFMELSAQEQTVFLGIDTSEIDTTYKLMFQERQDIGRDVKRLNGAMEESYCEKPDGEVDIDALYHKSHIIAMNNNEIMNAAETSFGMADKIIAAEERVNELKRELEDLNKICEQEIVPIEPIEAEIEKAKGNQALIQQFKMYLQSKTDHDKAESQYELLTEKLNKLKQDKVEVIKAKKFPFAAISVDENGGLLIKQNGKWMPFSSNFFSSGRMIEISIKLITISNPELKTVIIKDASLLDPDKLKAIAKTAEDKGLQILMEHVGDIEGENSITLVEGSIDES